MKKNVIKVPAGYTDVENIDEAIDFLFDNDVEYVEINGVYDEDSQRMSIKDIFDYFGIDKYYYHATTFFFLKMMKMR